MTEDEVLHWVREGFDRLKEEIDCCIGHMNNEEYQSILLHISNVALGLSEMSKVLFEFITQEQAEDLMRTLLELRSGQPMEVREIFPGLRAIIPTEIVIPDNLDDL